MTTLNKRAVAQVLANKPDDYVRQLLELRRTGARAAVNKFKRMLAYASPPIDRMRGTLRMYGAGSRTLGRAWPAAAEPEKEREQPAARPWSISIRAGDRSGIAQYGNPLALLGDVSRAALCASPGMELKSGDFSAIEASCWPGWPANSGSSPPIRPFSKPATRRSSPTASSPARCCTSRRTPRSSRRNGSSAKAPSSPPDLADRSAPGAASCRTIRASDDEIKAIIQQWRDAHPATRKFWKDLARAIRVAIRTGQPILVAPAPQPPIVAASPTAI